MESYAVLAETRIPADSGPKATVSGEDSSEILMSEGCPASIVVSEGGMEIFRGEGPIIGQLDCAMDALRGLSGITTQGYAYKVTNRFPSVAVSEALCNAVIHSEIAGGGEISVSVDEDSISITSPGPNCPLRHIDCGLVPRNPAPARVLKERHSANLCMSGIGKIRAAYFKTWQMPRIIPGRDSFTVLLPAVTNERRTYGCLSPRVSAYLSERPGSTFEGICDGLMMSPSAASMVLGRMESEGLLFAMGIGDKRRFYVSSTGKPRCEGRGIRIGYPERDAPLRKLVKRAGHRPAWIHSKSLRPGRPAYRRRRPSSGRRSIRRRGPHRPRRSPWSGPGA